MARISGSCDPRPESRRPESARERRTASERRRRRGAFFPTILRAERRRDRARRSGEPLVRGIRRSSALLVSFVFGASILDLVFTLIHLRRGAEEVNWLMSAVLAHSRVGFIVLKLTVTFAGCSVLATYEHMRIGSIGLRVLALAYAALLIWHLILFQY